MKDCIALGFWGKFQELVDQALKLEASEAIATQQQQIEQQRFPEPEEPASTMTLERRKQYAAEIKQRQALKKFVA